MDTNPVNTQHTVTAIFEHGDGSPAASVPVSISITSGPNSGLLADAMTNASGQVTFSYMGGPNPGTDVIEFAGVVDEQIARCTATKIWVSTPPSCTAAPSSATNLVGEEHEITVTVLRGDGSPAVGVSVTAQVTAGPHAGFTGMATTDASGAIFASYTGSSAGTDTIRFSGITDAQPFSCTATKTWLALPPPCTAVPSSDTNIAGTQHTVLVTFEHGDGSPAVGVDVSASIASGPNSPLLADLVTDASGQVSFVYTGGPNAGTDSLEFAGSVDGQLVTCSASKTWELPPPPCTVDPASGTNPVGTEHTVVATFRHGNGSPAPGVDVSISIASGPNAGLLADAVTTASGTVALTYEGGQNPGTDSIEFGGFVDGHLVNCSATKTWRVPAPPCTVVPAESTNPVGSKHTITAIFTEPGGSPASGVDASISIASGPNAGLLADGVTDAAGQVGLSYTGDEGAGTDVIEFSGFVGGDLVTCSGSKTWVVGEPTCETAPSIAANLAGTEHAVTAIFRRADGSLADGEPVSISISSGPNAGLLADGVTDDLGQVRLSYAGALLAGTDVIEFSGVVDEQVVACSAAKTWVAGQPSCAISPSFDVNPVGTDHTVTATFRRGDGSLASGVPVSVIISSGPNSLLLADAVADSSGRVPFTYTGGPRSGTDVIDFAGVVDDEIVRCSAAKTWQIPPPPCVVVPSSDNNPTGTDHTVTAYFRRADGSRPWGLGVSVAITSGPNAPLFADAVTDFNGAVPFMYTGGSSSGTDVIEFSAFLDGRAVRCSATKAWDARPPTCSVAPGFDVNRTGSQHTAIATFRRGNGSLAADVQVSISIVSGPNSPLLADGLTDAGGQVALSYIGVAIAGTDVIEFAGVVDGQIARCRSAKTWVLAQPTCSVSPIDDANPAGTRHTVTAVFRRGNGTSAAGVPVSIGIFSGPNSLLLADAVSNASGQVTFSYDGRLVPGTDVIEFAGVVDGRVVRCAATKTWDLPPPPCTVIPSSDTNSVGTDHTVTAVFRNGNGFLAGGVPVSISIFNGPNGPLLADAVTGGDGRASLTYTGGPFAGTDLIEFAGVVGGRVVRCAATKTWIAGRPSCDVVPSVAANRAGTGHTATAIFRRGNGTLAGGVDVSISITSGPNSPLLADGITNAAGQVTLSYTGAPNAGTDTIEFAGFVDAQLVTCRATKTWIAGQPSCSILPATAANPVGTTHDVTAVFRRGDGSAATAVNVSIGITSGPNSPLFADAVTDAGGRVGFSYTGGLNAGTDTIEFTGFVDGQLISCRADKTWIAGRPSCDTSPSVAANPAGADHTVRAIFRRGDGSLAAGVPVSVVLASGPNAPILADGITTARGEVAITYTGGQTGGTDVIEFSSFVDGQVVRCSATKTWVTDQPTCSVSPPNDVNTTGTSHTVSATFRRGNGALASGVDVAIDIPSGPNAPRNASRVTNASGQASFTYTGGSDSGTDIIRFSATVDGQPVSCRASKTWESAPASCAVVPSSATNPVGSEHTAMATFTRGDGSPAAGVNVSIEISLGPNAPLLADAVANANGEVAYSYMGVGGTGTDVIEFGAVVDGRAVDCSAGKTWVAAGPPSCDAAPSVAANPAGSDHTVNLIFRTTDGSLAAGVNVSINILSGPNAPRQASGVTNATGQYAFTYTGGPNAGVDVIEFSGMVEGQRVSCSATKTWVAGQAICAAVPNSADKPIGTAHEVTATFLRGDGSVVPGVDVAIAVTSGPNSPMLADGVSDARGQVQLSYSGGPNTGRDLVEFSGVIDGALVSCTASTNWVAGQPTCDVAPSIAANPVGTEHTVSAVFRRGDGSLASGVDVSISIASGPNAPLFGDGVTTGTGELEFRYPGSLRTGTDVIEFSGFVDGQPVSCTGTKTWIDGVPITPTPSATRTATPTGTRPTSTPTPTGTPPTASPTMTGSPPACGPCVGDCNGNCRVTIDELVTGGDIALGPFPVTRCPSFDQDLNGMVQINELVLGVRNALKGCPPVSMPTPVAEEDVLSVAGGSIVAINTTGVVASVVAGVINGIQLSAASASLSDGTAAGSGSCPLGGSATSSGSFPFVTITLAACKVDAPNGATVFDGTISVQLTAVTVDLDIGFEDSGGGDLSSASADLTGTLGVSPGGECFLTAATLSVSSGTLSMQTTRGQRVSIMLAGTVVAAANLTFNAQCFPEAYRLTFDGPASLDSSGGGPLAVTFDDFDIDVDAAAEPTRYELAGDASSTCYGGVATTVTDAVLLLAPGEICPTGGALTVSFPRGSARLSYGSNGSVDIDDDADGTTDATLPDCLDPQFFACEG